MRYKLLVLAFILLLATPSLVFGQETSPIVIRTGKPTPSVVRSGEPFKVTYRAEYVDLVLVMEEHIQPGNISMGESGFELTNLEVVTFPNQDDDKLGVIHVQEFTYTFRIIKPEKGAKKIPPFDFIWVEKKAGTTKDNTKQTAELQKISTDEVGIGYISSVIKPPPIDIRDEMVFSLPNWTGTELRRLAYGTITVFSLLALGVVVAWMGVGRSKAQKASEKTAGESPEAQAVIEVVPGISPKKARKKFLRELSKLKIQWDDLDKFEKDLYTLLWLFILAELSEGPVRASASDTPNELYARLSNLGEKQRKEVGSRYSIILGLSKKLRNYYEDIESGSTVYLSEPLVEIKELMGAVENLNWKRRIWKTLKKRIGR